MSDPQEPQLPSHVPPVPQKGLSTGCIIGLVVGILGVIGAIGFLAALAIPVSEGIKKKGNLIRTKAEISDIAAALKNYNLQYARAPVAPNEMKDYVLSQGPIIDVLMGDHKELNPRGIRYIEPPIAPQGSGPGLYVGPVMSVLVDAWGHPLRIAFPQPPATKVPDPEHPGGALTAPALIWSAGADGNFETWTDNVASWKP